MERTAISKSPGRRGALAWLLLALAAAASLAAPQSAHAELRIFACEPEWAALAEEIGGARVRTFSATHARQDPHYIRARPSLIAQTRRADMIVCSGAGLEAGWLPLLLQKAGGAVQPGRIGYLLASEHVALLDKPVRLDRSLGDIHPEGNPHLHLNPHNILIVADELTARLAALDAEHADFYRARARDFRTRWRAAIARWEARAGRLKGMPVVVHHKSFAYLLRWLGMRRVASLEPKPGIPPTAAHLQRVLRGVQAAPVAAIVRTPYEPGKASIWLSERSGAPHIVLPYTIGGDKESGNLFALFERTIALLDEARLAE